MPIQALVDLQKEITRLLIAGARFAHADPRLEKLAESLKPLADKSPVFKKLAGDLRNLAGAKPPDAAPRLAALAVLLHSVLNTQGDLLEPGQNKLPQIPIQPLSESQTHLSYLELAPLRDLAGAGSSRLELAELAYQQGLFADLRAIPLLDSLLSDRYTELAEYIANTVLPGVGISAAPLIRLNFRYEDNVAQARRIRVLIKDDFDELPEMVKQIFAGKFPLLQVEAVAYLAKNPENASFILSLAGERNKSLRHAAYLGLAALGTDPALAFLKKVYFDNKPAGDRGPAARALAEMRLEQDNAELIGELMRPAQETFYELTRISGVSAADHLRNHLIEVQLATRTISQLIVNLEILRRKHCDRVPKFLREIVTNPRLGELWRVLVGPAADRVAAEARLAALFGDLVQEIRGLAAGLDQEAALNFYAEAMPQADPEIFRPLWEDYLRLALQVWPKDKAREIFAPAFLAEKFTPEMLFTACFRHPAGPDVDTESYRPNPSLLAPDWAKPLCQALRNADPLAMDPVYLLALIDACEPPDSAGCLDFFAKLRPEKDNAPYESMRLRVLAARGHPKRYDYILQALDNFGSGYLATRLLKKDWLWRGCPKKYAERFRQAGERNGNNFLLEIAERIEAGESKPPREN